MDWEDVKKDLLRNKKTRMAYEKVDLAYSIGIMLIDARIFKNMTQQELADKIGTKQPSIARIERGDSLPSLTFLQKIADALDTQLLPPRLEFLVEQEQTVTNIKTVYEYPKCSLLSSIGGLFGIDVDNSKRCEDMSFKENGIFKSGVEVSGYAKI